MKTLLMFLFFISAHNSWAYDSLLCDEEYWGHKNLVEADSNTYSLVIYNTNKKNNDVFLKIPISSDILISILTGNTALQKLDGQYATDGNGNHVSFKVDGSNFIGVPSVEVHATNSSGVTLTLTACYSYDIYL